VEKKKMSTLAASAGFLFGLLFNPEDVGDMFLQHIALPRNYAALQPTHRRENL
jgi:hypothetical protein